MKFNNPRSILLSTFPFINAMIIVFAKYIYAG